MKLLGLVFYVQLLCSYLGYQFGVPKENKLTWTGHNDAILAEIKKQNFFPYTSIVV